MSSAVPESSATTHVGRKRDNNEDSYLSLPEQGLWLVADGMGGHDAGEVASAIVRETLQAQAVEPLPQAIQAAHRAVLEAAHQGRGAPGMGSTAVALRSDERDYEVAWVGDSRAYLWTPAEQGGELRRLTTDHSYVQRLLATGAIGEDQVRDHPARNIITQCLGSHEADPVEVESIRGRWRPGQWILLCSDGLTDELDDEALAEHLSQSRSPRGAVNRLLRAALDAGGRDNITLALIQSPLTRPTGWQRLRRWLPGGHTGSAWLLATWAPLISILTGAGF